MRKRSNTRRTEPKTQSPPRLALTHGQAIWLLSELGLCQGVRPSTFNYYVKSLRKLGLPFEKGEGHVKGHGHVTYLFEDLMELTIALLLRVYGTLPDAIAVGLREFRKDLRPIYRQAYLELVTHKHAPARISEPCGSQTTMSGLFLDLNIHYSAGQMVEFGPPKALSPFQAASIYARAKTPGRSYLPLNISAVAKLIVSHTHDLPTIRRGRAARRSSPV